MQKGSTFHVCNKVGTHNMLHLLEFENQGNQILIICHGNLRTKVIEIMSSTTDLLGEMFKTVSKPLAYQFKKNLSPKNQLRHHLFAKL